MTAYVIVDIDVHDPVGHSAIRERRTAKEVANFGGISRGAGDEAQNSELPNGRDRWGLIQLHPCLIWSPFSKKQKTN